MTERSHPTRDLTEVELDLITGGSEHSRRQRTWTFVGDPVTSTDTEGAWKDLRDNVVTGAAGGMPDPRRMIIGGLTGGIYLTFTSTFTISDHTRTARPVVTIHELRGNQRGAPLWRAGEWQGALPCVSS